ncbi:hypothetical protein C2845_PM11G17010 [Panicum miliaceum]|uniref:F-box protein AT5G49610-like beta-propeller domain-containing protein n=1 Tax=Panicum miliaceum TaxID=4540 RepID=A0A3L6RSY4_PANMI|nr:hypothetical protein C2845_PM11G17010 [Panicum miliaceum]
MEAARTSTKPSPPPQAESEAVIAAVFGSGDLLREILLRLDSPAYLIRAAAVSKRWLQHASDLPPPLPHAPLAPPPRLLPSTCPPDDAVDVWDCRNARLLVYDSSEFTVCSPLHPDPNPPSTIGEAANRDLIQKSLHEDSGDDLLCTMVLFRCSDRRASVHLSDLQDGAWGEVRNSHIIELPEQLEGWNRWGNRILLAQGKLYMNCMAGYILGTWGRFTIHELVLYQAPERFTKWVPDCLINVREFKIHVWHLTTDCASTDNWKLIDTICLRQAFGHLADPTWHSQDALVHVDVAGDNDDFVFLRIEHRVFCVHISSSAVEKVCEPTQEYEYLHGVYPFTMFWPPTFPVLNGGHDHDV